jgi:polysaccharide biosynthesis/export protein
MRIVRSLILWLGVAVSAAGCAREQVAYVTYPTAGIDSTIYGGGAYGGVYGSGVYGGYGVAPYGGGYGGALYGTANPAMMGGAGYATPGTALYGYAPSAAPSSAAVGGYVLDSGDRLRIVVFGQEGLTNSYVVGAGGTIDMPLIGAVAARGLTTDQLAGRIAEKLRDGFIREPHVAVEIESYRPFFILGEVAAPGQYPYVANMTVETAVAIAGGFGPRASRKSVVLTRNYYGRQIRMAVPLNFPLRPGDTISVQERWF